ncbi:hypothetical protein C2S53_009593 [Perilla frutescens var. hirtella]|uniref:Uncharacterized protein n=1 Tax=Perilla frutescens var. hirtella TaxID=608512 RepID=A0AAD4JQM0_PERFH|nr:hypothetical protein C2S53_009593 [Perilla frutescens var. hirtella]
MQSVKTFSESSAAITSATTSLVFFNPNRAAVYRSAFVPMNFNVKSLKNMSLKAPPTHCRASLEVQDSTSK